jgi:hypothetical protein
MLLVWRKDEKAIEPLEKLVRESKNPLARLHALAALDGMNAVKPEVLRAALADEHPGVLAHAVRLCENRFAADPELGPAVLKLVNKPEVALKLAGALGGWDDPRAGTAIGTILKTHGDDQFITATALSSLTPKNFPAVAEAVMGDPSHSPPTTVVERLIAFAVAKTDEATLGKMLATVAPKEGPFTTGHFHQLASLMDALERQKKSLADLTKTDNADLKAAVEKLEPAFTQARSKAMDAKAPPADRVAAVRILGRNAAEPANDRAVLVDLLGPQSPGEVQAAAVAALARTATDDTPAVLLKGWKGYSPSVRAAVLSALLARTTWVPAVLKAIEKKEVLPAEVDAAARQQLLTHKIAAVRETAGKLLAGGIDADRAKVIAAYKPALT